IQYSHYRTIASHRPFLHTTNNGNFFQAHLLVTFFVVTPEEASLSARLNATTVTGFSSALTRLE
ncbi:hypothetical protein, partial [Citrobacter amalonaticus]